MANAIRSPGQPGVRPRLSRPEVIRALRELTREGYAQACVFNGHEAYAVDFRPGQLADVWFCPTEKGMNAVGSFWARNDSTRKSNYEL